MANRELLYVLTKVAIQRKLGFAGPAMRAFKPIMGGLWNAGKWGAGKLWGATKAVGVPVAAGVGGHALSEANRPSSMAPDGPPAAPKPHAPATPSAAGVGGAGAPATPTAPAALAPGSVEEFISQQYGQHELDKYKKQESAAASGANPYPSGTMDSRNALPGAERTGTSQFAAPPTQQPVGSNSAAEALKSWNTSKERDAFVGGRSGGQSFDQYLSNFRGGGGAPAAPATQQPAPAQTGTKDMAALRAQNQKREYGQVLDDVPRPEHGWSQGDMYRMQQRAARQRGA